MGAIFYIYSISTILYCFLVIYLCFFHNRCIVYHKDGIYNAKLIVQGSLGAKIYTVFKYANFGSQTAPEALIMLFGNGISLQRVMDVFLRPLQFF